MNRRPQLLVLSPWMLFMALLTSTAWAQSAPPLIERAQPDRQQQARIADWLTAFESQRPALARARAQLSRERDTWRESAGTARCREAAIALERIDRKALFAVADYRLVAAISATLDQLSGAVGACLERRYFELDYRLGLVGRELSRLRGLVAAATGHRMPPV